MSSIQLTIKTRGGEQLIANVDVMNGKIQRELAALIQEHGEKIAADAKSNLPNVVPSMGHKGGTASGVDTGKLRASIRSSYIAGKMISRIGPLLRGKPHPLGHIVEFGTAPGTRDNEHHPGSPAIPYLFPAFERGKPDLERDLENKIRGLA